MNQLMAETARCCHNHKQLKLKIFIMQARQPIPSHFTVTQFMM